MSHVLQFLCWAVGKPSGVPFNSHTKQRPANKKTHRLKFQHLRLLKFPKNLDSCENMWKYWKKSPKNTNKHPKQLPMEFQMFRVIFGGFVERWVNPPSDPMIRSNFLGSIFWGTRCSDVSECLAVGNLQGKMFIWFMGWFWYHISSGQIEIIPNQKEIIPNQMCVSLNGGILQSPPQVLIIFSRKTQWVCWGNPAFLGTPP